MNTDRRTFLKYLAGGSVVIGAGAAGVAASDTSEIRPYRRKTSISPVATRTVYLETQPALNSVGKLSATLLDSSEEVMRLTKQDELPAGLKDRLVAGYDSGFWVVIVATLPLEADIHTGEVTFANDQIQYSDISFELEQDTSDELYYHYDFHLWKRTLPLAPEPERVVVSRGVSETGTGSNSLNSDSERSQVAKTR